MNCTFRCRWCWSFMMILNFRTRGLLRSLFTLRLGKELFCLSGILFTTICLMSVCSNIVERISRSNRFSRGYRNAPFVTRYSSDADDVMKDRETSQLQDKRRKIESFHFLSNRISLGSKKIWIVKSIGVVPKLL